MEDAGGKQRWLVGRVTGLIVYPVKSCRGVKASTAECMRPGLRLQRPEDTPDSDVRDRHWTVTDTDYNMMTLKEKYRLALISVSLDGNYLCLNAPDMPTIKVLLVDPAAKELTIPVYTHELQAVDCGEEIAAWLTKHMREGARLVHHLNRHVNKVRDKINNMMEPEHGVAFMNSTPYMLVSEETLNEANTHLPFPISMLTLRPNIIIEGCQPYDEEKWMDVVIGDNVPFAFVKPCTRCPVTLVDVDKGERYPDGEPMKTLRKFRPCLKENNYAPVLGNKYKVMKPGVINVGDPVYALE